MSSEPGNPYSTPLMGHGRLQKIDQLRESNVGAYLPLPQLVAVGDQSSGKSSLLESLTGIPFPRGQELCTRYATQITHRRETHQRIDVTILSGPHASQEHKRTLESYCKQMETTTQLRTEFPDILAQVNSLMGIKTTANSSGQNTFSEDVLRIERYGPNEDYLTIIDVPGIFRTTTEGVTTNKDKELVKEMVKRYVKDNRTIILAVLPSNVDVATQEILTLAEEADPDGDRTLGIMTKADLLKEQTAKMAVVNLVEGNRKSLKLGYHLVTNRGGDDYGEESDTSTALRQREAMFQEHPWSSLPESRVGILPLRERLQDLLGEITDRAFPELRAETCQKLAIAEKKLQELGVPRQTEREQQQYLVGVASSFQSLVRAALNADYSAHPAFTTNDLRLITAVVNVTDQFNADFNNLSRTYLFESEKKAVSTGLKEEVTSASPVFQTTDEVDDDKFLLLDTLRVPSPEKFPELSRIVVTDWVNESPKRGIMKWIEAVYKGSRGLELGSLGCGILSNVFQAQSAKWEVMTKHYLSKIILLVHRFILTALGVVCADTQVTKNVSLAIMDDLCAKYEAGMSQATFLVNIERQLRPYTLNQRFNYIQQRSRGVRTKETLMPKARHESPAKSWSPLVIDLGDVTEAVTDKSNAESDRETIHDNLEAYYKVAQERFVDNVFSQAVDFKLLSGPESPLRLFSEQWVLHMDADKSLAVAGESRRVRERRVTLKKEIEHLELAMRILY